LRTQIEDHIKAYIILSECSMSTFPCYQFGSVANRENVGPVCAPANRIAELPYRSSRVDDAVYEAMQAEMTTGLKLKSVLDALRFLASGHPVRRCDPGVEERFHQYAHAVPFLWEGLVKKAADRIGCSDCGASREVPEVSRAQIRPVLDILGEGYPSFSGDRTFRGLPALGVAPECNPNLAVAIARRARGLGGVASPEEVEAELQAMGVRLIP
jgi:hypothetical protein